MNSFVLLMWYVEGTENNHHIANKKTGKTK